MESSNKKRLKKNFKLLVDNLIFDEVSDLLYQEGAIDEDDVESINGEVGRRGKVRILISKIQKKSPPPDVFEIFCKALVQSETPYGYLADALENTDISDIADEDVVDSGLTIQDKYAKLQEQLIHQSEVICRLEDKRAEHEREIQGLREKLEATDRENQEKGIVEFDEVTVDGRVILNESVKQYIDKFIVRDPALGDMQIRYEDIIEEISCKIGVGILCNTGVQNIYVMAMQKNVDSISNEFKDKLDDMIESLHIYEIDGFKTVATLGDLYFGSVCNWGRVTVWFTFWFHVASRLADRKVCAMLGNFIGLYLVSRHRDWIEQNGGWDGFINWTQSNDPHWRRVLNGFAKTFLWVASKFYSS